MMIMIFRVNNGGKPVDVLHQRLALKEITVREIKSEVSRLSVRFIPYPVSLYLSLSVPYIPAVAAQALTAARRRASRVQVTPQSLL